MSKTLDIDLSDDRLISIASDLVDNHNYISALKMLNKNADLSGDDEDSLMLYAEIFDDMGLYEKSVNGWFRFMDATDLGDMAECYEGLAVNYMNLGNEHFAAYYYNKLLFETDDVDAAMREDILKDFMSGDENPLKFVYPPNLADCSEIILNGIERMKAGDYDGAVAEFDRVAEGNSKYSHARNYIAMCQIICDKTEEAEQECLNILKHQPDNVQALTTLAAVKTEDGKRDEARLLAQRLLALEVTSDEDIYKIATVCCENKMHEEAYSLFCRLSPSYDYDLNVLFFKGVSAFNCGKYEESFNAFDDLVTIYPEAVTGRYFYNLARELKKKGEISELGYFYRLPANLRESSLKVLAAFSQLSVADAKKLAQEVDLSLCIKWCFDECELKSAELQSLAAQAAVKGGLDDIVRGILLNAFADDKMKIEMLAALAERNEFDCFGVVICNIYKRLSVMPLDIGRYKKKAFVKAYSRLFAHFALLDDDYSAVFSDAAERLYYKLEKEERLDEVKNQDVLTAAVYVFSKVRAAEVKGNKLYEFFEVKKEQVDRLVKKYEGENE